MLYCIHCGARLTEGARFCLACGAPVATADPPAQAEADASDARTGATPAIASSPAPRPAPSASGAAAGASIPVTASTAGAVQVAPPPDPIDVALAGVEPLPAPEPLARSVTDGETAAPAGAGGARSAPPIATSAVPETGELDAPRVYVTMPYAGATLTAGQPAPIQWAASGGVQAPLESIEIDLCGVAGEAPQRCLVPSEQSLPGDARTHTWSVPADLPGGEYRVRVQARNALGGVGAGFSGPFTVKGRAAVTAATSAHTGRTVGPGSSAAGVVARSSPSGDVGGALAAATTTVPTPATAGNGITGRQIAAFVVGVVVWIVIMIGLEVLAEATRFSLPTILRFMIAGGIAFAAYGAVKDD